MTAEQLIDGLWGEAPPASAVQSLQVYVHGLRRALGADRIETAGRGYRVVVERGRARLDRFERTLERGRAALEAGRAEDAADDLREALAVWRGPALADLPDEIAEPPRPRGSRSCGSARSSFASTRSSRAAATTLSSPSSRRSRLTSRIASGSSSSGCSRSTAAAARRMRSRSIAKPAKPSRRISASIRAQPCRSWSGRSSGRTRASPLRKRQPARRSLCRCPRRRWSAAGSSSRQSARCSATRGAARHPHRPGRTGKTRIGLAVAHELEPELRDGALFVGLAPVSDPELLVATIAESLDVREGERNLINGVIEHLRERRMLLVLDNFEQILSAAPFVGDLLAAAPRLWILATSRAPLRLAAEREYPVPPFDAPDANLPFEALVKTDAVRLFAVRAQAVDPGFELDTSSAPEVARVCRRLDGLPLAIELAAARAKLLAPGEILERLEREPDLLQAGPRDAPARQQTLAATIHWSYDLLGPDERQAFARLGVFVGGCTLEAAEGVCDVTLKSLGALVDNNLLRRREGRFVMLETVRHFAAERLEEAGAEEVRRRHAEWLTELAETMAERTLAGEDMTAWLDRIQPEHDNIRAALAWSLEHEPELTLRQASSLRLFWEVRGNFREGHHWIEEALPYAGDMTPEVRFRALAASGAIAIRLGDLELAHQRKEAALALAREVGNELGSPASSATSARSGRCAKSTTSQPRCSRRAPLSFASSTCRPGSELCSRTSVTSPASVATTKARSRFARRRR